MYFFASGQHLVGLDGTDTGGVGLQVVVGQPERLHAGQLIGQAVLGLQAEQVHAGDVVLDVSQLRGGHGRRGHLVQLREDGLQRRLDHFVADLVTASKSAASRWVSYSLCAS